MKSRSAPRETSRRKFVGELAFIAVAATRILVKEQGHWITTAFQNTDVESRDP